MIYEFKGIRPIIHPSSFVHPQASVIGNVVIGKHCYIGPGAAIRGDFGRIIIKDGCNVQENCTIHMFPGVEVVLEENAHIGHGAIIHGCHIGENCLIGMNAVLMDNVTLGEGCIVGALSFVKADTIFEERSLIVGNPAKKIKEVSDKMLSWKTEGTKIYQQLAADMLDSFKICESQPFETEIENKPGEYYKPWKQKNDDSTLDKE